MIMLNNNLRIFMTAAELESLTETAKKLYISQPAVSHAIKKLEDELNVRLFIRNKRGRLMLTTVGKAILTLANQMASLENRLYQTAYDENHLMGGLVRIATIPLGASLILSHVLPKFKKQFPKVSVELLEGNPQKVKNLVLNYQADLGITTSPYMGMEHKFLMSDRMISINKSDSVNVNLRKNPDNLIFCQMAYDNVSEQLYGETVNLASSLIVQAASTQINMVANGDETGIISEMVLSSIPNQLVRGCVIPSMSMDISLVAMSFSELSTAALEIANMIVQRSRFK